MSHHIDVQFVSALPSLPDAVLFTRWGVAAINNSAGDAELTIRVVDAEEITDLNQRYRKKTGPTNVLSFPAQLPPEAGLNLLGDVVICAPVVIAEARAQGKTPEAHWAHLVVHGILHLQGFDHQNDAQAAEMETCEVDILARLGYSNPYETGDPVADLGG